MPSCSFFLYSVTLIAVQKAQQNRGSGLVMLIA